MYRHTYPFIYVILFINNQLKSCNCFMLHVKIIMSSKLKDSCDLLYVCSSLVWCALHIEVIMRSICCKGFFQLHFRQYTNLQIVCVCVCVFDVVFLCHLVHKAFNIILNLARKNYYCKIYKILPSCWKSYKDPVYCAFRQ